MHAHIKCTAATGMNMTNMQYYVTVIFFNVTI